MSGCVNHFFFDFADYVQLLEFCSSHLRLHFLEYVPDKMMFLSNLTASQFISGEQPPLPLCTLRQSLRLCKGEVAIGISDF